MSPLRDASCFRSPRGVFANSATDKRDPITYVYGCIMKTFFEMRGNTLLYFYDALMYITES